MLFILVQMFEERVKSRIKVIYFVALGSIMYYLIDGYVDLGVYVTYRHVLALLLIFSAFCCFIVKPDIPRMAAAFKSCLAFSAPTFVFLIFSLFIWAYNREEPAIIARGLSSNFLFINHFSSVFAAGAFLYIFGEKGIWYNLAALLIPYCSYIGSVMLEYGVNAYIQELWILIRTFAGETGDIIQNAEVHELAFCVGAYLMYMMINPRKSFLFWTIFLVAAFLYISAFKRIAIIAMLAVVPVCLLLKLWAKKGNKRAVMKIVGLIMLFSCAVLLIYVGLVHEGLFEWLEKAGVDTMSRSDAYEWAKRYYTFSPAFLGNGIGFLTYQLQNDGNLLGLNTIHNDFLQYFVDIGFWGYIIWLLSMTVFRTAYFGRGDRTDLAINTAGIMLWTLIVSATDNTLRYPLFITVMSILIMGCGFDDRVVEERSRIFGETHEIKSRSNC